MRIARKNLVRSLAAAAAVLTVAGIGTASALGSTGASPASAAHAVSPGIGSSSIVVHPSVSFDRARPMTPVPPTSAECEARFQLQCYDPDQVEGAYNLPALFQRGVTGKGKTIVIVDAFGSPTIADDLTSFDLGLGLSTASLRIVPVGNVPAFDSGNADMDNWALETTLDVEYSHAAAPGAKTVLVIAKNENNLDQALRYAVQHRLGDVISLSWGGTEQASSKSYLKQYESVLRQAASEHITIVASTGDSGASGPDSNGNYYHYPVTSWPATSPYVTAVGGTQLNLNALGNRAGPDAAWNDTYNQAVNNFSYGNDGPNPLATGGGKSVVFSRPSYQNAVRNITGASRGIPDISMSASCSALVLTYLTFASSYGGWYAGCGTSEAAPMFAAVVALADQVAGHSLGLINPALYALAARHAPGIAQVASGNNTVTFGGTTVHGYSVRNGYNLVTGLGTVNGQYLVPELAAH